MKKKLIGLLAMFTVMTSATGCTQDEIGYLQMSQEMLSHTGILDANGTIDISLDADKVIDLAREMGEVAGYPHAVISNTLSNFSNFNQQHDFKLTYDISMDLNSLAYDMKLTAEYNNVMYNLGTIYFSQSGLSVTPDTIIGCIKLYNASANKANNYLSNPDFLTAFETNLSSAGIISLTNNEKIVSNDHSIGYDNQDVINSVVKFYNTAFSDFSSGMVLSIPNGYQISTNGQSAVNLMYSTLDYISNNFTKVHKAFTDYTLEVGETTGVSSQELQEISSLLSSISDYEAQEARLMLNSIKSSIQETLSDPKATSIVNSCNYNTTLTKTSNTTYNAYEEFNITNDGSGNAFKYSNSATFKLSDLSVVEIPSATTTIDAIMDSNKDLVKAHNTVTDITLLWSQYGQDNKALLTEYRNSSFNVPFVNENYSVDYLIHESSMYAPLRAVTEALGENVGWDPVYKVVTITKQDGSVYNIQGMIVDGTTMVKIREFEKLGYTVLYEELDDNLRKATVSK